LLHSNLIIPTAATSALLRIPDHADQRSDRMPIIDSGPWRSGFRTMAITDSGLIPIS